MYSYYIKKTIQQFIVFFSKYYNVILTIGNVLFPQGRMGYTRTSNSMDQRGWQDLAACSPMLAFPGDGQHHNQHHHYGQHPSGALNYPPGPGMYHHHNNNNNNVSNVLLQNVSLCPPPPQSMPLPSTIDMQNGGHGAPSSSSSSLSHYHHHSSSLGKPINEFISINYNN